MKRTHVVIASEARQSSSTRRTLDCRVALFLIDPQKRPLDRLAAAQDKVLPAQGNGCY
jgi:hypothetical protein